MSPTIAQTNSVSSATQHNLVKVSLREQAEEYLLNDSNGLKESILLRLKSRSIQQGNCILWTGARQQYGYGQTTIKMPDGRHVHVTTHRLAYLLATNIPIPTGMYICHRCDVGPCINPDHLFLGTSSENHRDMLAKGRGIPAPKRTEYARLGGFARWGK